MLHEHHARVGNSSVVCWPLATPTAGDQRGVVLALQQHVLQIIRISALNSCC